MRVLKQTWSVTNFSWSVCIRKQTHVSALKFNDWNSFCLETLNSKHHHMLIENDRTMDALPEASVFLIALILDGFFKNEGIQAPREEEDPHMAHLMGFAEICYN